MIIGIKIFKKFEKIFFRKKIINLIFHEDHNYVITFIYNKKSFWRLIYSISNNKHSIL